jgi:hypothetical protein
MGTLFIMAISELKSKANPNSLNVWIMPASLLVNGISLKLAANGTKSTMKQRKKSSTLDMMQPVTIAASLLLHMEDVIGFVPMLANQLGDESKALMMSQGFALYVGNHLR